MKAKITRRSLMTSAAAAAVASAQTATAPADLAKATREQNQRASEVLAKFEIPLTTEPAFQFKA